MRNTFNTVADSDNQQKLINFVKEKGIRFDTSDTPMPFVMVTEDITHPDLTEEEILTIKTFVRQQATIEQEDTAIYWQLTGLMQTGGPTGANLSDEQKANLKGLQNRSEELNTEMVELKKARETFDAALKERGIEYVALTRPMDQIDVLKKAPLEDVKEFKRIQDELELTPVVNHILSFIDITPEIKEKRALIREQQEQLAKRVYDSKEFQEKLEEADTKIEEAIKDAEQKNPTR